MSSELTRISLPLPVGGKPDSRKSVSTPKRPGGNGGQTGALGNPTSVPVKLGSGGNAAWKNLDPAPGTKPGREDRSTVFSYELVSLSSCSKLQLGQRDGR